MDKWPKRGFSLQLWNIYWCFLPLVRHKCTCFGWGTVFVRLDASIHKVKGLVCRGRVFFAGTFIITFYQHILGWKQQNKVKSRDFWRQTQSSPVELVKDTKEDSPSLDAEACFCLSQIFHSFRSTCSVVMQRACRSFLQLSQERQFVTYQARILPHSSIVVNQPWMILEWNWIHWESMWSGWINLYWHDQGWQAAWWPPQHAAPWTDKKWCHAKDMEFGSLRIASMKDSGRLGLEGLEGCMVRGCWWLMISKLENHLELNTHTHIYIHRHIYVYKYIYTDNIHICICVYIHI